MLFRSTGRLLKQATTAATTTNTIKRTTGIAGLLVHPAPKEALVSIYQETLKQLQDIPETAAYRQSVEALTKHRLKIAESASLISDIEKSVGGGQIEEVVLQAQDELSLLGEMKQLRPWEPLEVQPPPNQWKYFGKQ